MLSVAVCEVPFRAAFIVACVVDVTWEVVMLNFALVAPAATFTLVGKLAALVCPLSVTTTPPESAGWLMVTTPDEPVPAVTSPGERVRPVSVSALRVSVAG
jgi:hypothetical protein